ncbi:MAG TPA: hypothetical protein VFM46_14975 [Pseudomonadales bacterium]|nr:hypothetical protein [Pseudomonadales bacterium]
MSETRPAYGNEAIQFGAQVAKVQTLIDGGIRLTLDLVEPIDPVTIVQLFDAKQPGIILEIAAVAVSPEKQESNRNGKISARSKWQPEGSPAER